MSASTPHPAAQIAAINDRYFALKTLILDYRKLNERTVVSIAETAISDADKAQTAVRDHLDKAENQAETIQGAAILMTRRTAAKDLLSLFEKQMTDWEKSEEAKLDKTYDTNAGYESLKTGHALGVAGLNMLAFAKQFRDHCRDLCGLFENVNKNEANRIEENNVVWKKGDGYRG